MIDSRRRFAPLLFLLVALLFGRLAPARASIPTQGEVVLIFVGVGAVGAAIGITAYHFAHKSPSLTGCLSSASGALTLQNESDHTSFTLTGNIAGLAAGERVRVSGKKLKNGPPTFVVDKVRKDYGTCQAAIP